MKIAISGKGGVGKTTISGVLCRVLGRKGLNVLAIDGDPSPNLSVVLGLEVPQMQAVRPLSPELLKREEDSEGKVRAQLAVPVDEVISMYGVQAPDNVTLLMIGKPDHAGTGCMCSSHATVREIIHSVVAESNRMTVLDMEASLEHMKRGTVKYIDALYIVVEPYFRSLEAAVRLQTLGRELGIEKLFVVANKVRSTQDERAIQEFCQLNGLPLVAIIPFDDKIVEADRVGKPVLDLNGQSVAVKKIAELADMIFKN